MGQDVAKKNGYSPSLEDAFDFKKGDRVLLYGNSYFQRLQESGVFEATIQLSNPGKELEIRCLAWTGDEVGYRLRPERYASHLKKLLEEWPADLVLIGGFGKTEARLGVAALPEFEDAMRVYIREIRRRHPGAKVVLVLPDSRDYVDPNQSSMVVNENVPAYLEHMVAIAEEEDVPYWTLQLKPDGHPSWHNNPFNHSAPFASEKVLQSLDQSQVTEVAKAVAQKAAYVSTIVRPINSVVYFGVRGRPDEYKAEMPRYHQLIQQADAVIHGLVADPARKFEDFPTPSLPPMPRRDPKGAEKEGIILSAEEQRAEMQVAEGYELNLFASEEQFPDLKNPLQITFGPGGNLWVVTMPSFPHTVPGEQPSDKILVLKDTDRDGVADSQTVFADGLNVPDGIVFYEDGVIVSAQPRLLYMWDSNGDGQADQQQELLRGIDVTDAHHGGMIAMSPLGHVMFCDGVFHRSQFETPYGVVRGVDATTYRFEPDTGRVSSEYQTLTPNPWKITFDRWGNLFQMYGDGFVQDSQVVPWTPLGVYHPFKRAISIDYGKGSGATVISSPNFPDEYQQGMASATLLGKFFVALSKLDPSTGLNIASDRLDIVSSDNAAFRPVDMAFGFDGAMYISDFCSPIVGHAQHPMRDPRWDHEHGRIWRVVYTKKPLVKEWPRLADANIDETLKLLAYPQDNVRTLARNRVNKLTQNAQTRATTLDDYIAQTPDLAPEVLLELLWLYESSPREDRKTNEPIESETTVRLNLLERLLTCNDFRLRAAATRLIRFQADRLPNPMELLRQQAKDPHPRVKIEVINAVSHLQQKDASWSALLGEVDATGYENVATMIADASHGTTAAKGPEVPVLEIPKETQLIHWLTDDDTHLSVGKNGDREIKEATIRTYIDASLDQSAIMSLRHQHVRVTVNGVQLLNADTWWSSDWNLQVQLKKGINEVEISFAGGDRARGIAPSYLFDPVGSPLGTVTIPHSEPALRALALAWSKANDPGENVLRISAVPNQLAFTPRELRIKSGQQMTLEFDNPDLQIHNIVLIRPGDLEIVGQLADQLALNPKAQDHNYVPESDSILWSSPLVNGSESVTLEFVAPEQPGRYPLLCTFPGHWRVMQATLIVE